jgi:hypothetical protein
MGRREDRGLCEVTQPGVAHSFAKLGYAKGGVFDSTLMPAK